MIPKCQTFWTGYKRKTTFGKSLTSANGFILLLKFFLKIAVLGEGGDIKSKKWYWLKNKRAKITKNLLKNCCRTRNIYHTRSTRCDPRCDYTAKKECEKKFMKIYLFEQHNLGWKIHKLTNLVILNLNLIKDSQIAISRVDL